LSNYTISYYLVYFILSITLITSIHSFLAILIIQSIWFWFSLFDSFVLNCTVVHFVWRNLIVFLWSYSSDIINRMSNFHNFLCPISYHA
jgi:hypothetical protein